MDDGGFDGERVTLDVDEETLERIDEVAWKEHRGNRAAAIRDLLDEWLRDRDG